MISTQRELRAAFWRAHPDASRRMIPAHSGNGRMYVTDTRVAWCDFIDAECRAGNISESLAERATLQPMRAVYSWEVQGPHAAFLGMRHRSDRKPAGFDAAETVIYKREA